jgi:hypothetical protein
VMLEVFVAAVLLSAVMALRWQKGYVRAHV